MRQVEQKYGAHWLWGGVITCDSVRGDRWKAPRGGALAVGSSEAEVSGEEGAEFHAGGK